MAKRKRSGVDSPPTKLETPIPLPPNVRSNLPNATPKRRSSARNIPQPISDVDACQDIIDAPGALRASPDCEEIEKDEAAETPLKSAKKRAARGGKGDEQAKTPVSSKKASRRDDDAYAADPEAEGDEELDEEEVKEALARPPPVNSDYLPLPWKGRLGYV